MTEQLQKCYEQLFYYFRVFQTVFPEDWPVPKQFEDIRKLEEHAAFVLKERRSQLVKTNGFGAILRVFPRLHEVSGGTYEGYLNRIERLREKISWKPQIGEILLAQPRPFKITWLKRWNLFYFLNLGYGVTLKISVSQRTMWVVCNFTD